jgi:myo-inositol-1(or 4)-monophosphatase
MGSLSREVRVAARAAARGAEVVREAGLRGRVGVRDKALPGDYVTEVDIAAEQAIVSLLEAEGGGVGVHGEERGGVDIADAWVVDPLDGTTNFAHGLPTFAVSIALEKAGTVVLGVVYDPIREETFVAERGQGARLNDGGIGVSETDELVRALVVTGFPYDRDEVPEAVELFGRFSVRAQGMRRLGSAALDLCFVAAGRLDAYYERGIHAWDVAAAGLILEEAGGKITDYQGRPFELEGEEMVASNGPLHPALIELTSEFAG